MIIPIGQQNAEVRRQPWVSWAIIALNVAIYVWGLVAGDKAWIREVRARASELQEYWQEHPYLEVPAELAPVFGKNTLEEIRRATAETREEMARALQLPPAAVVAEEQETLNRLAREVLAARSRDPNTKWGYVPGKPTLHGLVTHQFRHAGLGHLLGNMLFFFVMGPFLEDVFGRPLFAGFYLLAGAAGALAHASQHSGQMIALVGASGAIFGVTGAFLIRLHRSRIKFLCIPIFFLPWIRFTFTIPAFIIIPFWFLEQVAYANIFPEATVAWWAHIGGFLFGVAVAVVVKLTKVEEKYINPSIEGEIGWTQHPALVRASDARSAGDLARARGEAELVLATEPTNIDAWTSLYETEVSARDWAAMARAATRRLELYLQRGETELGLSVVNEARQLAAEELSPKFLFLAATVNERIGDHEAAFDLFEDIAIRFPADPQTPRALLRMSEYHARHERFREAREVLEYALAHPRFLADFRERALARKAEFETKAPPEGPPNLSLAGLPMGPAATMRWRALPDLSTIPAAGPAVAPPSGVRPRPAAPAPAPAAATRPAPTPSPRAASAAPSGAAATRPARPAPAAAPQAAGLAALPRWVLATISVVLFLGLASGGYFALRARPQESAAAVTSTFAAELAETKRLRDEAEHLVSLGRYEEALVPLREVVRRAPGSAAARERLQTVEGLAAAAKSAPAPVAASGPVVDLRIVFVSPIAAGQLVVKRNDAALLTRDFNFGKDVSGGTLDEIVTVPPGGCQFKVWVFSADRAFTQYQTLDAALDGAKILRLSMDEKKTLSLRLE